MINIEVLAIVGPTASGKTALSIKLAKLLNGEIINGDSMQVYKGLDIGTAKITPEEMEDIPHHLLDIKEPTDSFSVAEFQQLVRAKIAEIRTRGKLPILVGGTGLYIQSVLYDFQFTEDRVDEAVRNAYYEKLKKLGPEAMHEKLQRIDPQSAAVIHPNNTRRVVRALEIAEHSDTTKSANPQNQGRESMYRHVILGLHVDREQLYERINMRVSNMIEQGLVSEARQLWDNGIIDVQAVQAIGYKEIYAYFRNGISLEEAVEQIKQNSRRYAKRQLTYFRNKFPITWIEPDVNMSELLSKIINEMQESGH
ncbi:tRNA (adenosine(37)-N6)-dimethylallyltransferase MiaA [Paenisporosarcina antarctica]|uniref:tRNA (adenosine(37)-N6)-dimethylallyltransferase MiaA n=1 Tax=Paenisporosarcina antarctica TaxID=417367 RepID=UPI001AB05EEF|nr:tRNA (adenosine(37)-N6)-dimethylallyltransferase MiaA [Paenisporosarcina antarctica]